MTARDEAVEDRLIGELERSERRAARLEVAVVALLEAPLPGDFPLCLGDCRPGVSDHRERCPARLGLEALGHADEPLDPVGVAHRSLATIGFIVACSYVLWHTARYGQCLCMPGEYNCDGCRCQLVINAIDERRAW